jgi:diguanylate cyclase (GGDEF)-like protein
MERDALPFGSAAEAQTPPASAPQSDFGSDPVRLLEHRLAQQRALADFARRALRAPALDRLLAEGTALIQRFPASSATLRKPQAHHEEHLTFLEAITDVVEAASARFRAVEESRRAALHDPLTGLANRTLIMDHLELALRRATRRSTLAAVIFIDVDRFKGINDTFGHPTGDELLVSVAEQLHGAIRPADTAGRWGGDEFVVVCDELRAGDVPVLVERIAAAFDRPVRVRGMDIPVSVSIGVAVSGGADDPATLIADADAEMYRSKRHAGPLRPLRTAAPVRGGASPSKQDRLTLRLLELLSSLGESDDPLHIGGRTAETVDGRAAGHVQR